MDHCIFCDLIHGAGEVSVCYEDTDTIAFMDVQPVNAGHLLVVPREHWTFRANWDTGCSRWRTTWRR